MSKIALMTDSNSGLTQAQAKAEEIFVVPMPFSINSQTYFEDIDLTQDRFFEFLEKGATVSTSQPAPGDLVKLWDEVLQDYDQIIHIPMSSGLSGSYENAYMLAQDYEGKVIVVDCKRISVSQKGIVNDAKKLIASGLDALSIKEKLEAHALKSSIYVTVTTLEYLKKGGRITPAVALLGGMLKIKPILVVKGEKIDSFSKSRTMSKAYKIMLEAIENDITTLLDQGCEYKIAIAYSKDIEAAKELKEIVATKYPNIEIDIDAISLSVACHTGPGTIGIGVYQVL